MLVNDENVVHNNSHLGLLHLSVVYRNKEFDKSNNMIIFFRMVKLIVTVNCTQSMLAKI